MSRSIPAIIALEQRQLLSGSGNGSGTGSGSGGGSPANPVESDDGWGTGSGSTGGSQAFDYARNDSKSLDNDSYVIIDVLDNDGGHGKHVTAIRQGTYGGASIHNNGSAIIYNVGAWVGPKGEEQIRRMITEYKGEVNRWRAEQLTKINDATTAKRAALEYMKTFIHDPAAFGAFAGFLAGGAGVAAATLAGIDVAVTTASWASPAAAAMGLFSIGLGAMSSTDPASPDGATDDVTWHSNASTLLSAAETYEVQTTNLAADEELAKWNLEDPDSWISREMAKLRPLTSVTFRYKMEGTDSATSMQFTDAADVTIDLGGRIDYGSTIIAVSNKWAENSGSFELRELPRLAGKAVYGEMLKDWARKTGGIAIQPGYWYTSNNDLGGEGFHVSRVWEPPYWHQPGWDGFGFGADDIAAELNRISYFIDANDVDWSVQSPDPDFHL